MSAPAEDECGVCARGAWFTAVTHRRQTSIRAI